MTIVKCKVYECIKPYSSGLVFVPISYKCFDARGYQLLGEMAVDDTVINLDQDIGNYSYEE